MLLKIIIKKLLTRINRLYLGLQLGMAQYHSDG